MDSRGLEEGDSKPAALVNITKKTAWPLLGATTIGILTFLPIFLSPDTTGEYVRDLFIVLAVSLWLSGFLPWRMSRYRRTGA